MNWFWTSALQVLTGLGRGISAALFIASLIFAALLAGFIYFPHATGVAVFCMIAGLVLLGPPILGILIGRSYFKKPPRVRPARISRDEANKIRAKLLNQSSWKK